jgi:hypothetical protein
VVVFKFSFITINEAPTACIVNRCSRQSIRLTTSFNHITVSKKTSSVLPVLHPSEPVAQAHTPPTHKHSLSSPHHQHPSNSSHPTRAAPNPLSSQLYPPPYSPAPHGSATRTFRCRWASHSTLLQNHWVIRALRLRRLLRGQRDGWWVWSFQSLC